MQTRGAGRTGAVLPVSPALPAQHPRVPDRGATAERVGGGPPATAVPTAEGRRDHTQGTGQLRSVLNSCPAIFSNIKAKKAESLKCL